MSFSSRAVFNTVHNFVLDRHWKWCCLAPTPITLSRIANVATISFDELTSPCFCRFRIVTCTQPDHCVFSGVRLRVVSKARTLRHSHSWVSFVCVRFYSSCPCRYLGGNQLTAIPVGAFDALQLMWVFVFFVVVNVLRSLAFSHSKLFSSCPFSSCPSQLFVSMVYVVVIRSFLTNGDVGTWQTTWSLPF